MIRYFLGLFGFGEYVFIQDYDGDIRRMPLYKTPIGNYVIRYGITVILNPDGTTSGLSFVRRWSNDEYGFSQSKIVEDRFTTIENRLYALEHPIIVNAFKKKK